MTAKTLAKRIAARKIADYAGDPARMPAVSPVDTMRVLQMADSVMQAMGEVSAMTRRVQRSDARAAVPTVREMLDEVSQAQSLLRALERRIGHLAA